MNYDYNQHQLIGVVPIELDSDNPEVKDDTSKPGRIVYYILFGLFLILFIFAMINFCIARKLGKLKQVPMFIFYLSAITVITFRTLLFADAFNFVDWWENVYVIMLISAPTYIFLITGLSQVVISVQCIIKYKILEIQENTYLNSDQRKLRVNQAQKLLFVLDFATYGLMVITIVGFMVYTIQMINGGQKLQQTYIGVLEVAVFNYIIWFMLCCSTIIFIKMIRKRYGSKFKSAQIKLMSYLFLFSISFILRGSYDVLQYADKNLSEQESALTEAIIELIFYFFCEWFPLFCIFLQHATDFFVELQVHIQPSKTENKNGNESQAYDVKIERGTLLPLYSPGKIKRILQETLIRQSDSEIDHGFALGEFDELVPDPNYRGTYGGLSLRFTVSQEDSSMFQNNNHFQNLTNNYLPPISEVQAEQVMEFSQPKVNNSTDLEGLRVRQSSEDDVYQIIKKPHVSNDDYRLDKKQNSQDLSSQIYLEPGFQTELIPELDENLSLIAKQEQKKQNSQNCVEDTEENGERSNPQGPAAYEQIQQSPPALYEDVLSEDHRFMQIPQIPKDQK